MGTTLEALAIPEGVKASVRSLTEELSRAAGTNLAGLVLYGGLARGHYREGKSDVNVLVLLNSTTTEALLQIAPALGAAWRSNGVDPMVLRLDELSRAAEEFPVKFLDIQNTHVVLAGDDPLGGLTIDGAMVRHRLRQELRNLALRLRRRYLLAYDDHAELSRTLSRTVVSLCVQLGVLLGLEGKHAASDECADVFQQASNVFDLDHDVLSALDALRAGKAAADPVKLYGSTLALVEKALEVVGSREVGR